MASFGFAFAAALIVALIVTPMVRRMACRLGMADRPGARKLHKTAVPNVGGLAIVVALFLGFGVYLASSEAAGRRFVEQPTQGLFGLGAVLAMFVVGFVDDLFGLRARHKLGAQLVVAVALCAVGVRIDEIRIAGVLMQFPPIVSWSLTILWLVGLTNAVNLIDGVDGLAGSLAAVACGVLAILGIYYGQPLLAGMSFAALGGLLGFLFFNFHPARIFMGDGGSLSLGMFLATGAVLSLQAKSSYQSFAVPCLALGIPILDTTYCVVRRILDRRSPFAPDRGHIHHRLLDLGLSHRRIVLLMLAVTVASVAVGINMLYYGGTARMMIFVAAAGITVAFLWGVGYFRFRRTLQSLWQMHAMARERRQAQRGFEGLQLQMREAETFEEWWAVVCEAAVAWDFASIELTVQRRDAAPRKLAWRSESSSGDHLVVTLPIEQRRQDQPLSARVGVLTNGSLESAASRFRLFARLLDEHSIRSLVPDAGAAGHQTPD